MITIIYYNLPLILRDRIIWMHPFEETDKDLQGILRTQLPIDSPIFDLGSRGTWTAQLSNLNILTFSLNIKNNNLGLCVEIFKTTGF